MVGEIAIALMKRALNDMMSERPHQPGQPCTRHHVGVAVINHGRSILDTNEPSSFQDQVLLAAAAFAC
jgi:hypothetical protein